jgi:hypothetical protein
MSRVVAKFSGGLHSWFCLLAPLDWLIFWIRLTPWCNSKGSVLWSNTGWPRNWSHSFSQSTCKVFVQTVMNHVTWEKHNFKGGKAIYMVRLITIHNTSKSNSCFNPEIYFLQLRIAYFPIKCLQGMICKAVCLNAKKKKKKKKDI